MLLTKKLSFLFIVGEKMRAYYMQEMTFIVKKSRSLVPFLFFPYFCGINIEKCL